MRQENMVAVITGGAHQHLMTCEITKGDIESATRAMSVDLAPWKIRTNVLPSGNVTEAARGEIEAHEQQTTEPRLFAVVN